MTDKPSNKLITIHVEQDVKDVIKKLALFSKVPAYVVVRSLLAHSNIISSKHDEIFRNWTNDDFTRFVQFCELIEK